MKKVYGIDLGTTNSAIAVFENDQTRVIKNMDNDEVTPSVVLFTGVNSNGEDEVLVGEQAKEEAASNPDTVVQFVKRDIGTGNMFNFVAPSGKEYSPEMISSLILQKVCKDAEQTEGEGQIKDVVITVPAYFDDARRTATMQAGQLAGLNVVSIINEPTAAAIAFGLESNYCGKILVYDLGGGTFDVTLMDVQNGRFDVLATDGDHALGGMNFDLELAKIIREKMQEQGYTPSFDDDELNMEIREKAERTKVQLSGVLQAHPVFKVDGKNMRLNVSREEFENASIPLMEQTMDIVNHVLQAKNVTWNDIDVIVMIGGSTKMPMVKRWLENASGKELSYKIDPDTAVARGAAIYASTIESKKIRETDRRAQNNTQGAEQGSIADRLVISDVTSQSMGVITVDEFDNAKKINTVIIPNNTKIPAKYSKKLSTVIDNQTNLLIQVTEGNDPDPEYVNIIGERLLQIPPHPKNSPVEVIYNYDENQRITIGVIDLVTNQNLGTFDIERKANMSEEQLAVAAQMIQNTRVD